MICSRPALPLPYACSTFIRALRESENEKTIEASLAVIQNLSSGDWVWSAHTRTIVKKEMALETICTFIKHPDHLIVASACGCLKNLCKNQIFINMINDFGFVEVILEAQVQDCIQNFLNCDKHYLIAFINVINLIQRLTGKVNEPKNINNKICCKISEYPGILYNFISLAGENFEILDRNVSSTGFGAISNSSSLTLGNNAGLMNTSVSSGPMTTEEISHFKSTIVKKVRYLLYTIGLGSDLTDYTVTCFHKNMKVTYKLLPLFHVVRQTGPKNLPKE